jgi:hypothetical protein
MMRLLSLSIRKELVSFIPGRMNALHSFRLGNRINLNFRRFA